MDQTFNFRAAPVPLHRRLSPRAIALVVTACGRGGFSGSETTLPTTPMTGTTGADRVDWSIRGTNYIGVGVFGATVDTYYAYAYGAGVRDDLPEDPNWDVAAAECATRAQGELKDATWADIETTRVECFMVPFTDDISASIPGYPDAGYAPVPEFPCWVAHAVLDPGDANPTVSRNDPEGCLDGASATDDLSPDDLLAEAGEMIAFYLPGYEAKNLTDLGDGWFHVVAASADTSGFRIVVRAERHPAGSGDACEFVAGGSGASWCRATDDGLERLDAWAGRTPLVPAGMRTQIETAFAEAHPKTLMVAVDVISNVSLRIRWIDRGTTDTWDGSTTTGESLWSLDMAAGVWREE